MSSRLIAIATGLAASSIAAAQSQFSLVFWFASLDDGQTWQGGTVEVADPFARVRVRAIVDWESPGAYALASVVMDIAISGAGPADQVAAPARIAPFNNGARDLVVMRFGDVIKIDDVRDTPPGTGPYSISCFQPAEILGYPFSTERPAPVFEFALDLDGVHGTRIVNHYYPGERKGGEAPPTLYRSPQGDPVRPCLGLKTPLNLIVIPAPTSLGLILPFLALHRRRHE